MKDLIHKTLPSFSVWTLIFLAVFIFAGYFLVIEQYTAFTAIVFGSITAFFSYYAYFYTKEKIRLELFEKRWEIYESLLKFSSMVTKFGRIRRNSKDEKEKEEVIKGLIEAHSSFRGIGYHKTKALFSNDIHDYFDSINESYAWLISFDGVRNKNYDQEMSHLLNIVDTSKKLPDLMRPYVYFGEYKN